MNPLFADTSALYALVDADDQFHRAAANVFSRLSPEKDLLLCSSYVLVETLALLQTRLSVDAVAKWKVAFQSILDVVWVDTRLHEEALTALLAANQPAISLTDWTSFLIMREHGITTAFSFDPQFAQQGFQLLPQA